MKAVIIRRRSDPQLEIGEVDDPVAGFHEALIDVHLISLNPGELRSVRQQNDGMRIGWDFAGTVARSAADGTGPQAGARVVGTIQRGAWAERVAAATDMLAELSDDTDAAEAVCLPVPAMTAYVGLRQAGLLYGKNVLITGAAGALGQFAVQIGLASGATVHAVVRRPDQVRAVTCHGAVDVTVTDGVDALRGNGQRFDLALDVVGPGVSEHVPSLLAPGGRYVLVSAAGGDQFEMPILEMIGLNGRVQMLGLFSEIERGPDTGSEILTRLLAGLAKGYLTAPIGPRGDWHDISDIAASYMASDDRAKPVLKINGGTM